MTFLSNGNCYLIYLKKTYLQIAKVANGILHANSDLRQIYDKVNIESKFVEPYRHCLEVSLKTFQSLNLKIGHFFCNTKVLS